MGRKKAFSLVEILTAFVLVALTAALLLVPTRRGMQRVRFDYAVRELKSRIRLNQTLARTSEKSLFMELALNQGELVCSFGDEREPLIIEGIQKASIDGAFFKKKRILFLPGEVSGERELVLEGPKKGALSI